MRRQNSASLGLAHLLSPQQPKRFFQSFWGKRILAVQRDTPQFYADLPTVADFDFLVGSLAAPQDGWFSLVKGRAERPPASALTRDGTLDLASVYDAVSRGDSLLLTKLHRRDKAVAALCRQLELDFAAHDARLLRPIGANGYFTPPAAQGFAAHYDDHDVFVLQLAGTKAWRLYRRVIDCPLEPPAQSLTADETGPAIQELTLSPGDLIYIPRGFAHEAATSSEPSLHLTLSVYPATWRDVIADIVANDARFRRNLPLGFGEAGRLRPRDRAKLRALSRALSESASADPAAGRIAARLLAESDLPHGRLDSLAAHASVTASTRVKLADGVKASLTATGPSVTFQMLDITITADRGLERVFRRLARGHAMRAGDVPLADDVAVRLELVGDLLRTGYLQRQSEL